MKMHGQTLTYVTGDRRDLAVTLLQSLSLKELSEKLCTEGTS